MRQIPYRLNGDSVTINIVETPTDLVPFTEWVRKNPTFAFDTETTGLNLYDNTFKIRLAQFGNAHEAWVLPVERSVTAAYYAAKALEHAERVIIQNAMFDVPVVDRHWGVKIEDLYPRVTDTKIEAHLVDNRSAKWGGIGHSLEDLTRHYVSAEVADDVKGSMAAMAKRLKVTKGDLFTSISLADEEYLRYSGMDPVLTMRVHDALAPKVPHSARELIPFEHDVARICAQVSRTGYRVDREYSRKLSSKLKSTETREKKKALAFGVENVNSNAEVIVALEHLGWTTFGETEKGEKSVDKHTLAAAMESKDKDVAKLATAVSEAKRAGKWRETWVDTFLSTMDADGRCHPNINTLEARTGRMSITGIPAQTLPANDPLIRSCFVAEPGHVTLSTDFSSQELRVLAALSGDKRMLSAFHAGEDLHQVTADAAGVGRKAGKGTNFAVVFGGGWRAVHEQFGVSEEDAKTAVKAFWETYPGVKRYAERSTNQAKRLGFVTTPSGRRLHIDKDRPYSATNALVQSTARDVTCRALVRLDKAGWTPYMRLPIHDEVVFSVPADKAEWGAQQTNQLMQEEMSGLMISTESELAPVGEAGESWGSLYVDPDSNRKYTLEKAN